MKEIQKKKKKGIWTKSQKDYEYGQNKKKRQRKSVRHKKITALSFKGNRKIRKEPENKKKNWKKKLKKQWTIWTKF